MTETRKTLSDTKNRSLVRERILYSNPSKSFSHKFSVESQVFSLNHNSYWHSLIPQFSDQNTSERDRNVNTGKRERGKARTVSEKDRTLYFLLLCFLTVK